MKKILLNVILISLFAAMLLPLSGCTGASAEELPEPTEIPEETAAEIPEDEKASETVQEEKKEYRYDTKWLEELRASLPELPDIDISSWEFLLANYNNCINMTMPEEYAGFEGQVLDKRAYEPAEDFLEAIRDQGYHVYVAAAHRNFEYNKNHFIDYCMEYGSADEAAKYFLPPGCNEHQTGLAIDLTMDPQRSGYFNEFSNEDFLETDAYKWALEHCSEYGFINRYPEGKEEFYGYPCHCAGHFRYVGLEAAKYISENNLCLEEFIALYDPDLVFIPSKITD